MKFDFDQRIDRTQSISIKWSPELRQQMYGERDIIPMGIADMDFKTAPAVAEAIQRRAAHETYGYGYPAPEYLQACADWQKRRTAGGINKGTRSRGGLTARENVQCTSALRRGQRLPGDGYPSPGSFFLCSFSVLLKISCGFLAFIEKYGILIALVLRRMDRALSGHTMFGAFDAGTAPPHTSTDDLKRGKLP